MNKEVHGGIGFGSWKSLAIQVYILWDWVHGMCWATMKVGAALVAKSKMDIEHRKES